MATYTQDQIARYLRYIQLPTKDHPRLVTDPLHLLKDLHMYHMARVPFESLSLHYAKHRIISLDPEDLFQKIVSTGRGGYCMEVNTFFATVLRSLGFTLISVGGRVKSPVLGYKGWDHMVNLVTIDNKRYLVDVGFGADSPGIVPLEHDLTFRLIALPHGRLQYKSLEEHTDPNQRVWVFSTREDDSSEWKDRYSFVEIEFFPADFEVMNLRMSTTPQSFFVQSVMCIATELNYDAEEGQEPFSDSVLILFKDTVKRKAGKRYLDIPGKYLYASAILEELKTEEVRARALKKYFGIELKPEEQRAIRGLASELRA